MGGRGRATVWIYALTATALVGCAPVLILVILPNIEAKSTQGGEGSPLNVLLAFAVGGLLGDVFLHLLPHSGEHGHSHGHSHEHDHQANEEEEGHSHDLSLGLWVLAGILAFFMMEKFVRSQHGGSGHGHSHGAPAKKAEAKAEASGEEKRLRKRKKEEEDAATKEKAEVPSDAKEQQHVAVGGYLNLAADFSHNFTDGLALGASFLVSTKVGLVTTVAILLHEVPHEIGDFAILVQSGFTRSQAMKAQLLTAIGAMVGTVIGLLLEGATDSPAAAWILPFTAGGFIYVATTTVIPVLLEDVSLKQSVKEVLAMCLGVSLMVLIVFIE